MGKQRFPTSALPCFLRELLPYLGHEIPHCLCCLVLLLPRGVGVGPQGEPGVVVAWHGGYGLDVRAVLESWGGEGMPEIVEPKVLQAGAF